MPSRDESRRSCCVQPSKQTQNPWVSQGQQMATARWPRTNSKEREDEPMVSRRENEDKPFIQFKC
jgi:hypothetical protein